MRHLSMALIFTIIPANLFAGGRQSAEPENFIFFNLDRDRITEATFLETEAVAGAQLKFTWRELEPERNRYVLEPLLKDLRFLREHGKRLFIQIQDVSFDERINVPDYLVDPEFGGGVARKYESGDDDESVPTFDGWVARRWDPRVIARFERLFQALGKELDGRIEGVALAETSIGFAGRDPEGYTFESYVAGVKAIMTAAKKAFPRSHVILYANFMPGEWLPWKDKGYLRDVYEHAERVGVGLGGPDLLPHRRGQRNHSYKLIAGRGPGMTAGLAVQWGNLEDINPRTGKPVTVEELHRFARDSLRLDYVFWGTQEPYYTSQILPYLRLQSADDLR